MFLDESLSQSMMCSGQARKDAVPSQENLHHNHCFLLYQSLTLVQSERIFNNTR